MYSMPTPRVFLGTQTEVQLLAAGLSPREIWVHCMGRRGVGSVDMTLEDLRVYMFKLISDFVPMDINRFWSGFEGDPLDLALIFYEEKLMPKCKVGGKLYRLEDNDYVKAAASGIPYKTLIDNYVAKGGLYVSFETYVRRAVANRMKDGARGGVKGYTRGGQRVSIESSVETCGDSALSKLGLFTLGGADEAEAAAVWHDASLAGRVHKKLERMASASLDKYKSLLRDYLKLRSTSEADIVNFMDYVFNIPDTDDVNDLRLFAKQYGLERYI